MRRWIYWLVLWMMLLFITSGVAESLLPDVPAMVFTTEQLLEDYDQFWNTLHESFPFLSLGGRTPQQLEAMRLENRALIGVRVKDAAGMHLIIKGICNALNNVGHLSPLWAAEYRASYEAAVQEGASQLARDLILSPATIAAYRQIGLGDAVVASEEEPLPVTMKYHEQHRAVHLRFPTFMRVFDPEHAPPVAAYVNQHPEARHVIIDITGNGGGSVWHWVHSIASAFADALTWQTRSFVRLTDMTLPFQIDEVHYTPLQEGDAALPAFVQELGLTHEAWRAYEIPHADYVGVQVSAPVKRWLLVDERCFSAAEMFTRFCKDTGWATVVGSTTQGDGGSVMYMVAQRLNHTGLLFRFVVDTGANEDGSPNVIRGTDPDYPSKPGESPLDTCLRLIEAMEP